MFLYKSCNPYEWGQLINLSTLVKSYSMVARAIFSKKHQKLWSLDLLLKILLTWLWLWIVRIVNVQFSGMGQWDANVVHNWYLKYHSSPEFVFETDLLSISSESYRRTEMSVSFKMSGKVQISDRRVKFCSFCNGRNNCQRCENNF